MSTTTVNDYDRKRKSVEKTIYPPGIAIPLYPRLAAQIGFNDAVLLVQIDYWIQNLRVNVQEIEGVKWLNLSADAMRDRGFEHLSRQNINRTIERLVNRGLLRVAYLPGSRTKWLALNYEMIETFGVQVNPAGTDASDETSQEDGVIHSNNGTKHSKHGTEGSNNGMKRSNPPLYITDSKDQIGLQREGDRATARHSDKCKVDLPPSLLVAQIEESKNLDELPDHQPESDEKLQEMMQAIAVACKMDLELSWHKKQIEPYAKELLSADYTPEDVDHHREWWRDNDWRGKKGDVPRLRELADTLRQSLPIGEGKMRYSPDDNEADSLHRRADPHCEKCGGLGWFTKYDPRLPWEPCACIERSNSYQTHGARVST